jgi:hypothetical protein
MFEPIVKSYMNSDAGILRPVKGAGAINSASRTYGPSFFNGLEALYKPHIIAAAARDVFSGVAFNGKGTVEVIIKFNSWSFSGTAFTGTAGDREIIAFPNISGGAGNFYFTFGSSGLIFDYYGPNFTRLAYTTGTFAADVWHHLAITFDHSLGANAMKMYHDGLLVAEGNTIAQVARTDELTIMQTAELANRGFDGWMAVCNVYDYAKTDFSDRFQLRAGMNDQRLVI